jgi:hypothetical protein
MTGKEWKNFVKAFNQNKEKLSVLSGSSQKSVVKAVEAVLGGATTENIKQLQKCIGMFDAVYNNKK